MKRFWDKIKKGPSCWEWQAGQLRGYGWFRFQGKSWVAHRLAWTLTRGKIPEGLCVLHHCDNRRCCNPDHLFLGTRADNVMDMCQKGRHLAGHKEGARKRKGRTRSDLQGEKHGRVKLAKRDIEAIRKLYRLEHTTYQQLAGQYGVHLSTIWKIVHRKTWRHVS